MTKGIVALAATAVFGWLLAASAWALPFDPGPGSPFGTGAGPRGVTSGDFDGDGNADVAVSNLDDNTLSVVFGDGNGTFTPIAPVDLSLLFASGGPNLITTGDFNNDDIDDIAVTDFTANAAGMLYGDGSRGFIPAVNLPVTGALGIDAADLDNDSDTDLVVASSSGSYSVFLNNGIGLLTATPASPVATGTQLRDVVVGNFDGDALPDLAFTGSLSPNLVIQLGTGAGAFTPAPSSPRSIGQFPFGLTTADFDGDGNADLATSATAVDQAVVVLGDGTGAFGTATGYSTGSGTGPRGIGAADFNNDGIPDLAVVDSNTNAVSVLLGDGTGAFSLDAGSPYAVGSSPDQLAVGGFTTTGLPDLAVTNNTANSLSILLDRPAGPTPPAPAASTGAPVVSEVAPASGPADGGTEVRIRGENLSTAKRVWFGDTPSDRFTVDRFDELRAVAPPHAAGTVSVRVENDAGTSPEVAAAAYRYDAAAAPIAPAPTPPTPATPAAPKASCTVPRVTGHSLSAARRKLRGNDCALGNVRRVTAHRGQRSGRILRQSARPGSERAAGSHVRVTVAVRR